MNSRGLTHHNIQSPAVRFHLNLADRSESEAVDRYQRHRRLADEIVDAARRADAIMRLEIALRASGPGPLYP